MILEIDKNEWKTSTDNWDCKVEGPRIVLRSGPRKIELIIRTEPPGTLVFERISMYHRGFLMECSEKEPFNLVLPGGTTFSLESGEIEGGVVGIHLSKSGISVGDKIGAENDKLEEQYSGQVRKAQTVSMKNVTIKNLTGEIRF